ncbi:hypothetical protein [Falsiroseomonas oryzae]|uniref:hypothetical protein n=1 Tax=Falsiroseomonas oryzae TaxID=2766473 RepID=UPI0022EB4327|nr:hypothetical protein [Roseomonas sp. MO-31]
MIRLANLTFTALLDHVHARLLRTARGRSALPARAYLADEAGHVTMVGLPALEGTAEHEAAGAVLGVLMRDHAAAHAVLQLPHLADQPDGAEEIVGLYAIGAAGRALGQRRFAVERGVDGRIARLVQLATPRGRQTRAASAVG